MSFKSALIEDADYHVETSEVVVTFKSGKKYRYYGVSEKLWDNFKKATSKGTFFHENFRSLRCEEVKDKKK